MITRVGRTKLGLGKVGRREQRLRTETLVVAPFRHGTPGRPVRAEECVGVKHERAMLDAGVYRYCRRSAGRANNETPRRQAAPVSLTEFLRRKNYDSAEPV
jgi:hypothetical protein